MRGCLDLGRLLSALLVVAPLFACSCTVKEDRSLCPCYTFVDLTHYINSGHKTALVTVRSGSETCSEEIELINYEDRPYELALPKGTNHISVISGLKNTHIKSDSLVTPYGLESDALWVYNEKFVCNDDQYNLTAVPRKNFCKMTIIVVGLTPGQEYDFSFRVKADCNAIDLYDSEALEGEFYGPATQSGTLGLFSVCLPRQKSSNLLMDICDHSNEEVVEAVHTIDVGSRLSQEGYDWTRADLLDVNVTVDYSSMDASIEIVRWIDDDKYIDVEI